MKLWTVPAVTIDCYCYNFAPWWSLWPQQFVKFACTRKHKKRRTRINYNRISIFLLLYRFFVGVGVRGIQLCSKWVLTNHGLAYQGLGLWPLHCTIDINWFGVNIIKFGVGRLSWCSFPTFSYSLHTTYQANPTKNTHIYGVRGCQIWQEKKLSYSALEKTCSACLVGQGARWVDLQRCSGLAAAG